jgi:DNA ligase (NAD+)
MYSALLFTLVLRSVAAALSSVSALVSLHAWVSGVALGGGFSNKGFKSRLWNNVILKAEFEYMNKADAKKRIEKLRIQIEDLRYRYHVLNDPAVTDDVKDSLEKELRVLESQFPEFVDVHSPTNRVAGKPLDKFVKVSHEIRMLSLNDVFSVEELRAWEARIKKLLPNATAIEYFAEVKMDGLAVSLIYRDGFLTQGATRGDGFIGEDITQNLRTIESIPLKLRGRHVPSLVEVRGEAVMTKAVWLELNKEQEKLGRPAFANTRNAAAGSLRQLDARLTAARKLDFYAWDIAQLEYDGQEISQPKLHSEELGVI